LAGFFIARRFLLKYELFIIKNSSTYIMKLIVYAFLCCTIIPAFAHCQTYSTDFDLTENPVSENGRWTNGERSGIDWTNVKTGHGIAFGTQTGTDMAKYSYKDSYAVLSGFPANQSAEGVVQIINPVKSCNQEVELLLRWTSSAHLATGYECLTRCLNSAESYTEIVRWNGALGDFTYLAKMHSHDAGLNDGDTIRATIIGNQISMFVNGKLRLRTTDASYNSGNPGIGFFLRGCSGSNSDFGFTSFKAAGL
jgi:hypothetical protein